MTAIQETWVWSLGWEDPEKNMATHSSIFAWRFHGQRSLADFSPWGRKESTQLTHTHTHTHRNWDLKPALNSKFWMNYSGLYDLGLHIESADFMTFKNRLCKQGPFSGGRQRACPLEVWMGVSFSMKSAGVMTVWERHSVPVYLNRKWRLHEMAVSFP